jgi:alkaline phosphatase
MLKKNLILLIMMIACVCHAQQSLPINPPTIDETDLITPVNIKPLTFEEVARKRGLLDEKPARNIIILFGSGFLGETASIYRTLRQRKHEINEMESMQIVLPTICAASERRQIDLISFLTGNGRVAGIVSDSEFDCSSACDFLRMKTTELFDRAKMALSLADFTNEEERDKLVKKFSGRNIEYATNRRDLDRLFSGKAEKVVGCFKRNPLGAATVGDISQPYFDELVTATLSRLSVEKNGFLLLVGSKGAAKARDEGRFADMLEHLKIQEKVMHQINYFVSGRKDTLVIIVEDLDAGSYSYRKDFKLADFVRSASEINKAAVDLVSNPDSLSQLKEKYDFLAGIDENTILDLVKAQDSRSISVRFQQALAEKFSISFSAEGRMPGQAGFVAFSRGVGAGLLGGLMSYEDFIKRLSLITGLKQ